MDQLIPVHHSWADWIRASPSFWILYPGNFHSAPTSLSSGGYPGAGLSSKIWLKPEISGNLKDGKLTTWAYKAPFHESGLSFYFREQDYAPPGPPNNAFQIVYTGTWWLVGSFVGGIGKYHYWGAPAVHPPISTWYQYELMFWSWQNALLQWVLSVQLRYTTPIDWYTAFLVNILNPPFQDSDHNYIGFSAASNITQPAHLVDDTCIYRPV